MRVLTKHELHIRETIVERAAELRALLYLVTPPGELALRLLDASEAFALEDLRRNGRLMQTE